jgi:hypothetical protein
LLPEKRIGFKVDFGGTKGGRLISDAERKCRYRVVSATPLCSEEGEIIAGIEVINTSP